MFSNYDSEPQKNNNPEIEDLMMTNPNISEENMTLESEREQPQAVKLVERISGIVSPYFIVLVGLYLYEKNFLVATILIVVGILSLLKISYQQVVKWFGQVKTYLFGEDDRPEEP